MIAEVIAVGTELLIGQIVNSNGATIGSRLADAGIDAHHQVVVGDNLARLCAAIRAACDRADAVILTGGIGPTQDDLTKDAICHITGRAMERDAEHAEMIRTQLLATRGHVGENTLRMADCPAGAETLPNRSGLALGVALQHGDALIFAMPGVPSEMEVMLDEQVMPRLRAAAGGPMVIRSRVLRTWGHGEAQVAELLDDLYEASNPSIAFLIDAAEVRIRITAKAESDAAATALIAGLEAEVVDRLGAAVFGRDHETIESLVVALLAARGWTIRTVESSTCGMVATRLAAEPGGRVVFAGGHVVAPVDTGAGANVEARARALLDLAPDDGEVTVAVSEVTSAVEGPLSARHLGVAVRTPGGTASRTVSLVGDDDRARQFGVPGALHAVRLAISGEWWA